MVYNLQSYFIYKTFPVFMSTTTGQYHGQFSCSLIENGWFPCVLILKTTKCISERGFEYEKVSFITR